MRHDVRSVVAFALGLMLSVACDDERKGIMSPSEPPPPDSETALIDALEDAYRARSIDRFEPLFHGDFWFFETAAPVEPAAICRDLWICTHRRLFEPQNIPPSREPLPPELWLRAITITVRLENAFDELPEYYRSQTNPSGLDQARWRVSGADAVVSILFETQGETDYTILRRARLVVAEDRSKTAGQVGKYSFYLIVANGAPRLGVQEDRSWAGVLRLFGAACAECPPPPPLCSVTDTAG